MKPTYVKAAFEYAYDELKKQNVQNKVTLFYNDYDTYFSVDDELALISYINEGEEAKICGGIGMQSHVDIKRPTLEEYGNALKAFINAGLEVQITELDITINFDTDDTDGRTPTYAYKNEAIRHPGAAVVSHCSLQERALELRTRQPVSTKRYILMCQRSLMRQ